MFRELSQSRITFVCGHCEHEWTIDYEIRHVEDGHGHSADYYARNGLPAVWCHAPGPARGDGPPHPGDRRRRTGVCGSRGTRRARRRVSIA